jgi:hypothetical protein
MWWWWWWWLEGQAVNEATDRNRNSSLQGSPVNIDVFSPTSYIADSQGKRMGLRKDYIMLVGQIS